jgi:polysaccharide pyruvyl transferase WcaK-like protein
MKKITVLGNFSGRNAGDIAILGNLLKDISAVRTYVTFLVPTINPNFIKKNFSKYNIEPKGLLPWNGALKIFGIPTLLAMINTDLILITDNILFDRQFYNPVFNYLSTISLISTWCRKRNIPIVLYNASLGPITSEVGKKALQRVLDASSLLILRDEQSKNLLSQLGLRHPPVSLKADCAVNTIPTDDEAINVISQKEGFFRNPKGTISFNINNYIDDWDKKNTKFKRQDFLKLIGLTIDKVIETLEVDILYVVTQIQDVNINQDSFSYVNHKKCLKMVTNEKYSYRDISGFLKKADIHVGMRTHSLILSAAVNTPMISINSYPKNAGFMRTIGQEKWMIDFNELNFSKLSDMIISAWYQKEETRASMLPIINEEKKKARESVSLLLDFLDEKRNGDMRDSFNIKSDS